MNLIDYFNVPQLYSNEKNFFSKLIIPLNSNIDCSQFKVILLSVLFNENNITKAIEIIKILYNFSEIETKIKVLNAGNLKKGHTFNDVIYALRDIYEEIIDKNQISIVLTDNVYITLGIYLAYELKKKILNISEITSFFSCNKHFLNDITKRKEKTLLNYTFIGLQKHLTNRKSLNFIERNKFDYLYLSEVQEDPLIAEPFIRDSNIIIFNYNSLINSYLDNYDIINPNGFTPQDLCLFASYYGQCEVNGTIIILIDDNNKVNLVNYSQIIWYFLENFKYRCNDYPIMPLKKMEKINVKIGKKNFITFYKSPRTQRMWIEIPVKKLSKTIIVPCSEKEYLQSKNGILPLKWIKYTEKFM
ncbi:MAG: hypothetical protein N3A01_05135 [Bacteroidales bacterium]|nr:hypothetical protein [Bacteroidales bacterium]